MTKRMAKRKRRRGLTVEARKQPGTPPGTIHVDPSQPRPEIHVIAYGADDYLELQVEDPDEIRQYLGRWPVTWVNVDGLGDAEIIQRLGDVFSLHPLVLEDVVSLHQRPKVERYGDTEYIVLRMVQAAEHPSMEQVSVILKPGCLITFQELPGGDCLDPVRNRLRKGGGRLRGAPADFLAYAVLDAIIDHYFPVLERIGERMEVAEDLAISSRPEAAFEHIHGIRQDLLLLRRAIWPLREALSEIMREGAPFSEETCVYLRDCADHAKQLIDVIEMYRELASGLFEVGLSANSHRTSEVMRVLTVLAAIFIPMNFVAALYGMNFNPDRSPFNMPELNWYFGYPFALSLMGTSSIVLLLYFRRRGWLGSANLGDARRERNPP